MVIALYIKRFKYKRTFGIILELAHPVERKAAKTHLCIFAGKKVVERHVKLRQVRKDHKPRFILLDLAVQIVLPLAQRRRLFPEGGAEILAVARLKRLARSPRIVMRRQPGGDARVGNFSEQRPIWIFLRERCKAPDSPGGLQRRLGVKGPAAQTLHDHVVQLPEVARNTHERHFCNGHDQPPFLRSSR